MEGMRGGRIIGVGEQDMSDGMQCPEHPYITNPGGGICPLCLRDRLRDLLSSSFPFPLRGSYASSSASPPSLPSQIGNENIAAAGGNEGGISAVNHAAASSSISLSLRVRPLPSTAASKGLQQRRATVPLVPARKKTSVANSSSSSEIVFKRSKSTATPISRGNHYLEDKRGGFWSFLYLSTSKPYHASKKTDKDSYFLSSPAATARNDTVSKPKERALASSSVTKKMPFVIVEDDDDDIPSNQTEHGISNASVSPSESKVSRSRSVGCGSRSFSSDFFERISTGFGDCALRRVESQRAAKPRISASSSFSMKEDRVRCGSIFGGFVLTPSSHSSPHRASASSADHVGHGRSRSWVWSFASPMRASTKTNNTTTPDL